MTRLSNISRAVLPHSPQISAGNRSTGKPPTTHGTYWVITSILLRIHYKIVCGTLAKLDAATNDATFLRPISQQVTRCTVNPFLPSTHNRNILTVIYRERQVS